MKKLDLILSFVLERATFISTVGLILIVLLQIFARFFLVSAPAWTEEAARIFFIYTISFAAGIALKDQYYVNMDLLYNALSKKLQHVIQLVISGSILLLFGIFKNIFRKGVNLQSKLLSLF